MDIYPTHIQGLHLSEERHPQEHQIIDFADRLLTEGRKWQEDIGIDRRIDRATSFLAGEQYPRDLYEKKKHRAKIVINKIRSIVERKTAMLTDTRAIMDVVSRSDNAAAAQVLKDCLEGLWTERRIQQSLTDGIIMAQKAGYAPCYVAYDPSLDFGRGDISVRFLQPQQVYVDRMVQRASDIQDGEYVIIQTVRPLAEFKERYPNRGHLVTSDRTISVYSKPSQEMPESRTRSKLLSPLRDMISVWRKPSRQETDVLESAIPRAFEYQLYFRDRTLNPKTPFLDDGTPNYLFPRKRVICWNKDVLLHDGPSRNWDGLYPVELLDWGIETAHPFGESEVDIYRSVQEAINVLVSGVVDSARLTNDPPWKARTGSLLPSQIQDIEQYGDRPGKVIEIDNLTDLMRDPPGAQSALVLGVVQALVQAMEYDSGLTDVLQGRKPAGGPTSGIAIESLQMAAQATIRLQARATEDFLSRITWLMISRIIQYWTDKRLLYTFGPTQDVKKVIWDRQKFKESLMLSGSEEEVERTLQDAFRDYTVLIHPISSLKQTKLQYYAMVERLVAARVLPRIELLKAAEISGYKEKYAEAQEEQMQETLLGLFARSRSGGPSGRPMGIDGRERRVPAAQKGGAGIEQR